MLPRFAGCTRAWRDRTGTLQELLETLIDMLAGLIALGVLVLIIALIVAQPQLAVVIILAAIATKESGGSDDDARKAAERAAVDA